MKLSVSVKHQFDGFEIDAEFDAPSGMTILFGRSGSGKTSIINALAGIFKPHAGQISLNERTLFDSQSDVFVPAHRRRIGYIFQDGRLLPHLTVQQNLVYGQRFSEAGRPLPELDAIVEMLGLGALLGRRPNRLSGGEKQRVAIGRALLSGPDLLLADEPLAALDDARKEEIMPYFEQLRDGFDVPILYVSHAPSEVVRLATTLVVLENGRVVQNGAADQLLSDPDFTPLGAAAAGVRLTARVIAQHADGITEVKARGARLLLPKAPYPVGAEIRMRIAAQDIIIATEQPDHLSALNVLSARICAVRRGKGPGVLVQLDAGGNLLLARVTQRSADALNLHEGAKVFAILKAVAVPRGAIGQSHSL